MRARVSWADVEGFALLTLALALVVLIAGPARFVIALGLDWALTLFISLPVSSSQVAFAAIFVPLLYAVSAVCRRRGSVLGRGRVWRWQVGAREPTTREVAKIVSAANELARSKSDLSSLLTSLEYYIIDEIELPIHMSRGRVVILARGMIDSPELAAILGHELGHIAHWDSRLTEAFYRLQLWDDPLREGTNAAAIEANDPLAHSPGAWVFGFFRWLFRLAGAADALRLLGRPLAGYWRRCEFRADAFAAQCGQGQQLLKYLRDKELPVDGPQPGLRRYEFEHPFVAQRIDRLEQLLGPC